MVEELNNFFSNKQYSIEVLENFLIDYLSNTSAISDALSYTEKDFEKNYLSVNGGSVSYTHLTLPTIYSV